MELPCTDRYAFVYYESDKVVLVCTVKRSMLFRSLSRAYEYAVMYCQREDWMQDFLPDMLEEQKRDGIHGAFHDFRVWYEARKSRAKNHIRMVGKLLIWHKHSVEKLWNPSKKENMERIMSVYYS